MKKIISLFVALVMTLSCFAVASPVYAGQKGFVYYTVNGRQHRDVAVSCILNRINTKRAENGLGALEIDKEFTAVAEKRAAEIMVCTKYDDDKKIEYLPDGRTISAYLPDFNISECTSWGDITKADAASLADRLSVLIYGDTAKVVRSVGLALFSYKDTFTWYLVLSSGEADEAVTTGSAAAYKLAVKLKVSNIIQKDIGLNFDKKYTRYSLQTAVYADGYYSKYLILNNAQLKYSSTNPGVLKVKGAYAYPKKNGKFTIKSVTAEGTSVVSKSSEITFYISVSTNISALKSTKKKTAKVVWNVQISDSSGYQVQYSTDKKFKKGVKNIYVKGAKKKSVNLKKLKSRKVYYVRIRHYFDQGNGEKAYGKWCKVKHVKIK